MANAECIATFNYQAGGTLPAPVSCAVAGPASGSANVSFTASQPWISVTPASASVDAGQNVTVNIAVNPAGLSQGSYAGQVAASSGASIPVSLTVAQPSAETPIGVSASPSTLTFSNSIGSPWPPVQNIQIASNPSGLPFNVALSTTDGGNWLSTNTSTGTAPAALTVGVSGDAMPPGTYLGTVTITSPGSNNPPQVIGVTLSVGTTVSFTYQLGSPIPPPKCFALSGAEALKAATSGERWLSVNLGGASACLSINPAGLAPGTYTSTLRFPPSSLNLQVVLIVIPSTSLKADLGELFLRYQPGWTPVYNLHIASQNPGAGVGFTATASTTSGGNWLSATASNAATPATLAVRVNTDGMGPGSYQGQITLAAVGGGIPPQSISVSLLIPEFRVAATPQAVSFTYELGLSVPAPRTVAVMAADTTGTPAILPFSLQPDQAWVNVSTDGNGTATVTVNPSGLAKGTYSANLVVTAPGTKNSPITVPVTLAVVEPTIAVQPAKLFLDYEAGSTPLPLQVINVASGSGQPIQFSASFSAVPEINWLSFNPSPGGLTATVAADRLPQGMFRGTVTVTSPNAANSPMVIPVTVRVRPRPALLVRPTSLSFFYSTFYGASMTRKIAVWGGATDFTVTPNFETGADWMTVTADQNTTPATLSVTVNPQTLSIGTYYGSIAIQQVNGDRAIQTIPVTFTVGIHGAPSVSPASVVFETQAGSGKLSQEVGVTYNGDYDASSDAAWLSTAGGAGRTGSINSLGGNYDPTTVRLKVVADTSGLAPGTYNSTVTLTPTDPASPPATVPVKLVVRPGNLTIPHLADGGGWKTGIVLVNADPDPAPFTIKFWQADGTPLAVALDGVGTVTEYSDTLPAGGSRTVQTLGSANAPAFGWAEVLSSKAVRGTSVVRLGAGGLDLQAAVPIRTPLDNRFLLPLEDAGGTSTMLALVNPAAQPATANLALRDETGRTLASSSVSLPARQRVAFTIQDQFPAAAGLRGVLEISSGDARLAAASLRLRPGASMSSVDPVALRGPASGTDVCPIAQINDGAGARTKLVLVNSGTEPAPFSLAFRAADGTSVAVPIDGAGPVTEYADTIPVGGMRVIATAGVSDSLVQAGAELASSKTIDGSVFFLQRWSGGSELETAAALEEFTARSLLLPFDNTRGSNTSLALSAALPDQLPSSAFVDARDENGVPLASAGLALNPRESKAVSLTDWLPALRDHRGVLELSGAEMGSYVFWYSPAASMTVISPIRK